ncbi:MAG: hypothetical protein ACK5MZ_09560, partial [Aestuariibaculum sp.]
DDGEMLSHFIIHLNRQWDNLFSALSKIEILSSEQLKLYSVYTFYFATEEILEKINFDNTFKEYVISSSNYLDIENPNIDKLIEGFKILDIKVEKFQEGNEELIDKVYSESLYKMNFDNIEFILSKFYQLGDLKDIKEKNYSLISSQPTAPLSKYIEQNINEYIKIVLENCEGSIRDDEQNVLNIINNDNVSDDNMLSYIEMLETKITKVNKFKYPSYYPYLIKNNIVKYSEENIYQFYSNRNEYKEEFKENWIVFINSNDWKVDFAKIKTEHNSEEFEELRNEMITMNEISDDK